MCFWSVRRSPFWAFQCAVCTVAFAIKTITIIVYALIEWKLQKHTRCQCVYTQHTLHIITLNERIACPPPRSASEASSRTRRTVWWFEHVDYFIHAAICLLKFCFWLFLGDRSTILVQCRTDFYQQIAIITRITHIHPTERPTKPTTAYIENININYRFTWHLMSLSIETQGHARFLFRNVCTFLSGKICKTQIWYVITNHVMPKKWDWAIRAKRLLRSWANDPESIRSVSSSVRFFLQLRKCHRQMVIRITVDSALKSFIRWIAISNDIVRRVWVSITQNNIIYSSSVVNSSHLTEHKYYWQSDSNCGYISTFTHSSFKWAIEA